MRSSRTEDERGATERQRFGSARKFGMVRRQSLSPAVGKGEIGLERTNLELHLGLLADGDGSEEQGLLAVLVQAEAVPQMVMEARGHI